MLCAAGALAARAANPIQIENARPGTASWRMSSEASGQIEGYPSATSVAHGDALRIYVNTTDPTYALSVFRMGWYDGLGARRILGPVQRTGTRQVIPQPNAVTGLVECDWIDPYVITIPHDWVSGVYLVKLTANAAQKEKFVLFVVRDDTRRSNHNFQLTVTTSQAYNNWGGKSLYPSNSTGEPADKVSFSRPYTDGSGTGNFLWRWEYNMVRFLEREGYDVTYTTNIDTHRDPAGLLRHSSFLSIGHDEYWSHEMRANVEAAIAAGVNMGFFSGNNCYWQIRFEPHSITGEPLRTMVSYKEDALTRDPFAVDNTRANDGLVTTRWRDAPVSRSEAAFLGVEYVYNPIDSDVVIHDVTTEPWVFEGTGLQKGSVLPGLLGYEVDAITINSPAGVVRLGHSPFVNQSTGRTEYSNMTVYFAPSGAVVFSTGTIQWSWGVDEWKSSERTSRFNPAAQQITRNVLRRLAGAHADDDCFFAVSARSVTVAPGAGTVSIPMTTSSWCSWSVTSNAPWLRLTSASSGTGPASLEYTFESNPGPARTATIDISGNAVMITQDTSCTVSLSPAQGQNVPAEGGLRTLTVTPSGSLCTWSASTKADWIRFESGTGGAGSGVLHYRVKKNTTTASRDGAIFVNGIRFNVHQSKGGSGEQPVKRRRSVR